MAERRYAWLKLQRDFFQQRAIKKLRKMAGGDTYTIICLEMYLLSLDNEGVIVFEGVEDTFEGELALALNEATDDVKMTMLYLESQNLLEFIADTELFLPDAVGNMGSESYSAERMRRLRAKQQASLCDGGASHCDHNIHLGDEETETERDTEGERTPARKKYGQYGWVKLSDEEYSRLSNDLGEHEVKRCIAYIDESAQSTGNKNKWRDWNLVLRKCSRGAWGNTLEPETRAPQKIRTEVIDGEDAVIFEPERRRSV